MQPSWAMVRTSMSRVTRTVTTTRVTATRTRISAPAMVSKVQVMASKVLVMVSKVLVTVSKVPVTASSRGLAVSRAIPAAPDRDLPRREAEAPAASLEARAVRTPLPRAKDRPTAER